MLNRTLSALAAVALSGATLAIATPAFAQSEPTSVFVPTADLDLSTAAGARRLDLRLRSAAEEVCGEDSRDLRLNAEIRACKARATSRARVEIAAARRAPRQVVALGTN